MELFQHTINKRVVLKGEGVMTGRQIKVELSPAPANRGLIFERADLDPPVEIPLREDTIFSTAGATLVGRGKESIIFVEHLLAALAGLAIDNLRIRVFGPEIPLFDGSARVFAEAILSAGRRPQWSFRRYLRVLDELAVTDGVGRVVFRPANELRLRCTIDFAHPAIGRQEISLPVNQERFLSELSYARTFAFLEDVIARKKAGLLRGGNLETAIILDEKGVLNPDGLRLPDEFVRHKALDLVGDLYLFGVPILAEVEAYRSSHRLHVKALQVLWAEDSLWGWYPSSPRCVSFNPKLAPEPVV